MCLGITIAGGVLGMLTRLLPSGATRLRDKIVAASISQNGDRMLDVFERYSSSDLSTREEMMDAIVYLADWKPMETETVSLSAAPISKEQFEDTCSALGVDGKAKATMLELWESTRAKKPSKGLLELADKEDAALLANYAVATLQHYLDNAVEAAEYYLREAELHGSEESRSRAIALLGHTGQFKKIQELGKDPSFQPYITPRIRLKSLIYQQRWWSVFCAIPSILLERLTPAAASLALLTGFGWYAFLIQAGQWWEPKRTRWWLCLLGVGLGILSIWPTDFLIVWQEHYWGLEDSQDVAGGLKYYLLGVGFREEFSKLLLLLPLMPLIVRRGSELEALMVSASVGLGFAVLENAGYFSSSMDSTAGRFLTANFAHMALTGLTGLAVARAFWHGGQFIMEAFAYFGLAIFVHAWYDALISLPGLAEYSFGTTILFILLAYQFFHELRSMRKPGPEPISLTAVFLACLSLLVSATFVYFAYEVGVFVATAVMLTQGISMALMVYMLLREMPNSIISV